MTRTRTALPRSRHTVFARIAAAFIVIVAAVIIGSLIVGCAALSQGFEKFEQAWNGVPATFTTYTQAGELVDEVRGTSFRVTRDDRFDSTSTASDGSTSSNKDSKVLLISLANGSMSHVGSTAILAEDGLAPIAGAQTSLRFENYQPGVPWINDIVEKTRGLTKGKAKLIMVRSQDGTPIAVYAGTTVEPFATEVPSSTWFRVDGKMLWVYRADYTTVDIALL